MILRIRTILDVDDDVIRDIEIEEQNSLNDLYIFISKSYGFDGKEMGSFFESDENWIQGKELNLVDFEAKSNYSNSPLNKIFDNKKRHLIFVYDFLALWTFYVEVVAFTEPLKNGVYPNTVFSKGKPPENPPTKSFNDSHKSNQTDHEGLNYDEDEFY